MNSQYAELEQILEEKPAFSFRYVTFEMASGHASGNVEEGAVHMGLGSKREVGTRHLVMEKMRQCQCTEYIYSHWNRGTT